MAKFRKLGQDELTELEKEFVEFLIVNGIDAHTWEKMKENQTKKAEAVIDQFSEVVFTSIFRKNEFVDFITTDKVKCFHFQSEQVVLVGVDAEDKEVNFLKASIDELKGRSFKVYTTNKKFQKSREEEMFDLIESGGKLSDGQLFKKLCLAL